MRTRTARDLGPWIDANLKRSYDSQDGSEVRCFCPFHDDEDEPSFSINRNTGLWYCFTEQTGGGLRTLRMRLRHEQPDEDLAARFGMQVFGRTSEPHRT